MCPRQTLLNGQPQQFPLGLCKQPAMTSSPPANTDPTRERRTDGVSEADGSCTHETASAADMPMPMPHAIAHRGYKAAFPENTMAAFRATADVGAHAIETDLHLSKDGVVVLAHDSTLLRCFGVDKKVADCDWDYLSGLRTLRSPKQPMPRLYDLLAYLAQPGLEKLWLLLDIKRDDDPKELLSLTLETIMAAPVSRAWKERIVFGCWTTKYISLMKEILPGFPIAFIGFDLSTAWALLDVPDVSFNLFQRILVGPWGRKFLAEARARHRAVFVWTVNAEEWMEWSIRHAVDGVITDDPKLFLDVCDRFTYGGDGDGDGDDDDKGTSERGREGSGDAVGGKRVARMRLRRRRGPRRWARIYLDYVATWILAFFVSTILAARRGSSRRTVRDALRPYLKNGDSTRAEMRRKK